MKNKSQLGSKVLIIIACILSGMFLGGAIAEKNNKDRYAAIDMLNRAANFSGSSAYSAAAGIGEIEAENNIQAGYVVGGLSGLFLGLIIFAVAAAGKKNDSDIQKDSLGDETVTNRNNHEASAGSVDLAKINPGKPVEEKVQTVSLHINSGNTSPSVSSLLRRAEIFLEDGDFISADKYFDRVLDIEPECARAYIGKLLAELKLKSEDELASCGIDITENGNYKKAVRFADDTYREKLSTYGQVLIPMPSKKDK